MEKIQQAARIIASSSDVLVFSGAGVSAESGIPTFRGEGGLWERYPTNIYANLPGLAGVFLLSKDRIASFFSDALRPLVEAKPNPAHEALARLEEAGKISAIVTQNIDDLHLAAGSREVLEVHGSAYRVRCSRCGAREGRSRKDINDVLDKLDVPTISRRQMISALNEFSGNCLCGGRYRPDVVFFGESLPMETIEEAADRASRCDCLLSVGTSVLVYPAATVPAIAASFGASVIDINPCETTLSSTADVFVKMKAGKAMPAIADEVLRLSN